MTRDNLLDDRTLDMFIASAEEDVQDAEWSAPEAVLRYLRLIRVARAERDKARDRARDLDHVATLAKERGNRAEATATRYRDVLTSVRIGLVESHEAEGARLRAVMFIDLALAVEPKAGT